MKKIWDELSTYITKRAYTCGKCVCNLAATLSKEREDERVHQFLMGLDDDLYGTLRSNVIAQDPLPPLNKVYALVVQEERHKTMTKGCEARTEAVAFVVHGGPSNHGGTGGRSEKGVCTNCGKQRHDVTSCFKIIGYPEWWNTGRVNGKSTGKGKGGVAADSTTGRGRGKAPVCVAIVAHFAAPSSSSSPTLTSQDRSTVGPALTDDQWSTILNMFKSLNNNSASKETLTGKSFSPWILDAGASYHMTGDKRLLMDVSDIFISPIVLPDGTHTNAVQEGTPTHSANIPPSTDSTHPAIYDMDFVTPTSPLDPPLPPPTPQIVMPSAAFVEPTHNMASSSSGTDGLPNGSLEVRGSDPIELEAHATTSLDGTIGLSSAPSADHIRRSSRDREQSVRLRDYVCHTARCLDPPSPSPTQSPSSGTPYPIVNYVTCNNFSASHARFLAALTVGHEPTRFSEAIRSSSWHDAMRKEIEALENNGTWTLEDLPPRKKTIGCKWVYKIKYHFDGTIERHKARLVILGNNQVAGIDFKETFAPVAKMVSVRVFLAVAVVRGWELHQMDVHNAFLHGDLDEEVYMSLPPGFSGASPGKVCRLRKSLYGLR